MVERCSASGPALQVVRIRRSDPVTQRVLLVADRSVADARRAPISRPRLEQIADDVVARTERGLELDVFGDVGQALLAMRGARTAWRAWRYDLVVALVPSGLSRGVHRRLVRIAQQAAVVVEFASSASFVLVARADRPGLIGRRSEDRADAVPSIPSCDSGDLLDSELDSPVSVTEAVVAGLAAPARSDEASRSRPVNSGGHIRAVASVPTHLERVLRLGMLTFEVPSAQLASIGADRVLMVAAVDGERTAVVPHHLWDAAMQAAGPLVVPDVPLVPHLSEVGDASRIRFFAAHPIDALDGRRVGVYCVFDVVPHPEGPDDRVLLRDLAELAGAELALADDR